MKRILVVEDEDVIRDFEVINLKQIKAERRMTSEKFHWPISQRLFHNILSLKCHAVLASKLEEQTVHLIQLF